MTMDEITRLVDALCASAADDGTCSEDARAAVLRAVEDALARVRESRSGHEWNRILNERDAARREAGALRAAIDEALRALRANGLNISEARVVALAGYTPADLERAHREERRFGQARTHEVVELSEEVKRLKAEAGALRGALEALVDQVDALAAESTGVAGLHLNGDVADWAWLYDEWLSALAAARALSSSRPADAHPHKMFDPACPECARALRVLSSSPAPAADEGALRGALEAAAAYIRYGDGQAQDLSGAVQRGRHREPVVSHPSRGEALASIDRALSSSRPGADGDAARRAAHSALYGSVRSLATDLAEIATEVSTSHRFDQGRLYSALMSIVHRLRHDANTHAPMPAAPTPETKPATRHDGGGTP